jgi:hypothetical protein
MGIFKRSKLKVKSESIDNNISYYIDYHNLKASNGFISDLLSKISQGENYLVVIDTKMLSRTTKDVGDTLNKLISTLEKLQLKYRVLKLARDNRITLLGAIVNMNDKKKSMDTIIGTIVDIENIKVIKEMLSTYFVYYFYGCNKLCTDDEMLDIFEKDYNNESLKDFFSYNIFDSNFLKQLVINTTKDNSESVLGIIRDINSFNEN